MEATGRAIAGVRIERVDFVTTVILDRPDRRNAVDVATARALADAFRALDVEALAGAGRFAAGEGRHGAPSRETESSH